MELPDLRLLRAAIVLSELRHYSRAAKKLGIQQPTLTKRIVELEQSVGFKLFLRTTQFVEPTDACRQLVQESREAIFHAERAIQLARETEKGADAVLHIGKTQYIDPYLLSMLNAVSLPLHPNLRLFVSNLPSQELEQEVLLGKLDLALVLGLSESTNSQITQLELSRKPFYVLLSESMALADESEITLQQLKNRRWALFDRSVYSTVHESILEIATNDGYAPISLHNIATAEEAAQQIYENISDVAFLTQTGAWRVARNGLTMRPLNDERLGLVTHLIARSDNMSRLVSEFTRSFKRSLELARRVQLNLPLRKSV